jgi:HPr kinase/phosphorylase
MQPIQKNDKPSISVSDFVVNAPAEMKIELIAGDINGANDENRRIVSARIQKLGLALAGFSRYIHTGRLQMVGQSEISYLNQLEKEARIKALRNLDLDKICCILITKNLKAPAELLEIAEEVGLPVLRTPKVSSIAISIVSAFLQEALAPEKNIHGVLVGMYGIGVLICGNSGIGKSECALDLITRGHNLIADDSVIVKRIGNKIQGSSPDLTREHLEIRGLGIINVREVFGITAVGKQKKQIDLCVELKKWDEIEEVERLGLDTKEEDILGIKIIKFVLPVSTGRTTSTLVETAIRVHLLRLNGYDAAQNLIEKHTKLISTVKSKN